MLIEEIQKYKLPAQHIKPVEYFADETLFAEVGNYFVFDSEVFTNFYFLAFKSFVTGRVITFERSPDTDFNAEKLKWLIANMTIVGFNSLSYDEPILWAAIDGLCTNQLKALSDSIIFAEMRRGQAEAEFGFRMGESNHIDLIEVAPSAGLSSLKQYGGRMHVDNMQDLPYDYNQVLNRYEANVIRAYCINDLDQTAWLLSKLTKAIELREQIGLQFGIDLRSKSDAQVAEAVIKHEVAALVGKQPKRNMLTAGTKFKYQVPEWVRFYTKELQDALDVIASANFVIEESGKLVMPKAVSELKIRIKRANYQMGIGGLHSCEKQKGYVADEATLLVDRDVESYYPSIILNERLFPDHIGPAFLDIYGDIVRRRLEAKKNKDKTTADSLKISINGTFGKLGDKWSCLYSPNLMLQVTVTGQLALLMLIEMLEWCEIEVISANTDGIVFRCPQDRYADSVLITNQWEKLTGFKTEETQYRAYFARDVNNYIAIGTDGKFKAKGEYANELSMKEVNRESLMKNPNAMICSEAVMLHLRDQTPIEATITNCKEFRKFVIVRKVKGGAVKDNCYIGKVIRWYMRKNEFGTIRYVDSNNTVPDSTGGYPCMYMPQKAPNDIDYAWYIQKSLEMLKEIGFYGHERQLELFR